jgi:hypothetical protein
VRNLWAEIDDADPPEADLVNAAEGERFVNCHAGQNFSGYIDYIILSRSLAERRVPGSFRRDHLRPSGRLATQVDGPLPGCRGPEARARTWLIKLTPRWPRSRPRHNRHGKGESMNNNTPSNEALHVERRLHTRHRARTTVYITIPAAARSSAVP